MHNALWDYRTSNIVDTEGEAFAVVRDLLAAGWSPAELGLGLDFDEGESDDRELPEPISGAALADRARLDGRQRLSA